MAMAAGTGTARVRAVAGTRITVVTIPANGIVWDRRNAGQDKKLKTAGERLLARFAFCTCIAFTKYYKPRAVCVSITIVIMPDFMEIIAQGASGNGVALGIRREA
jgi:hypothetical protein